MKPLHARFTFFIVLFMLFFSSVLQSQTMTAIDPGPYVEPDKFGNMEEPVSDQPVNIEPIAQKDEYGVFNFNAYLSGLGSTGGYVAIPGMPQENGSGSVEAWVYPTATTSSSPYIVGKGDATNVGFIFGWVAASTKLYIRFGNTPTINTAGTNVPLNTWTHVAATWTGGAGNFTVQFYVNGAASGAPVNNAGTWNLTNDSTTIGNGRAPFSGKAFYGLIDEVRFWGDVRTAAEIRDNRFVGLGDGSGANTSNALTSSSSYAGITASFNFSTGGNQTDYMLNRTGYMRSGATTVYSSYAPQPMPYNFAGRFTFGANDYVTVPDNSAFNQNVDGSVEAWVYPTGQTTTHMIISRGTTGFQFFWGIRSSIGNRQVVNIGSGTQFQNSNGIVVPLNQWSHVAAVWTSSGGNFTVTFYVNGQLSGTPVTNATTWTSTSGTLRIGGWHGGTANNFNGYIDEVRYWQNALSIHVIRANMFASGRTLLPNTNLLGIWNFDGNLLNRGTTAGINGSYSTGGTNNCRISGFRNETSTGALSTSFVAHATVINQLLSAGPYPFPQGYAIRIPNKPITDNSTTRDTITIPGSGALTSINVFLAIRHTYAADLDITLRAPNGTTRDLTSDNGGTGEDVLTFFVDGTTSVTTTAFYPPWSRNAGPEVTMGNFGATNIQGNWILEVADDAGGDVGSLIGWGIRFNNGLTNSEPISSNVPDVYRLYQNYPNPFNPVTNIKFDIPKSSPVKIIVYDILGREVKTLVNEFKNAGAYELNFDASNIASGTYIYRIEAGDFVDVKKMVLIK